MPKMQPFWWFLPTPFYPKKTTILFTEYWNFGPPSNIPLLLTEQWNFPNPPSMNLKFTELWSS